MIGWRRRARDEGGAVLVFVALTSVIMIGSTALAVDIGQVTTNNRSLQANADVIALDAARALGGGLSAVTLAAQQSADRNQFPKDSAHLKVQLVTKNGVSAVQITTYGSVKFAFAPGQGVTTRSAVATQTSAAGFSVGSFLASIPAGGNTVLHAIFGSAFNLSLVSYDGLANANVTLGAIAAQLNMTPSQLISGSVNMRSFLIASLAAVSPSNTAAVNLLGLMRDNVPAGQTIDLGRAIKIETGGETAAATAQLNLLQMLTANALIVDGTHTLTIPEASLTLPDSIGDVKLTLQVTEPAKTVFGPVGTFAQTAQVKATVEPTIRITTGTGNVNVCSLSSILGNLLGSLFTIPLLQLPSCLLGIGTVTKLVSLDLTASVPISVEAVGAKATLAGITCGSPKGMTLQPLLQPATLTSSVNVQLSGSLLGAPLGNLLQVTGSLNVPITGAAPLQNYVETDFGKKQTVGSTALGLGTTNPVSLSVSVLNNSAANAVLAPLGTLTAGVLSGLVNPLLAQVSTAVLEPLNHLLGLNLFGADLTPLNVECGGVRLAG